MNDKERLQQIIDSSVISPCEEKVAISKEGFDWLVERAEKVSRLELEIEYWKSLWESAVHQKEEFRQQLQQAQAKVEQLQQEIEEWKLENQSLSGSVEIIERKRQELVKQLAIANERIERYEEFIRKIAWWDTFPANPFKAEAEQLLKETK